MKRIKRIHTVLALALLLTLVSSKPASAEDNIDNLSPNIYEEKERNNSTDFFSEEPLNDRKAPIPEEQKNLTFNMKPDEKWENVKNKLFAEGEREKSSVAAKAKQLQLFSGKDTSRFLNREDESADESGNSALTVVYLIVIALGVLVILLLMLTTINKRKEEAQS